MRERLAKLTLAEIREAMNPEFYDYMVGARKRFVQTRLHQETQIMQLYKEAGEWIAKELRSTGPGKLKRAQLEMLRISLKQEAARLETGLATIIKTNMKASVDAATELSRLVAHDLLLGVKDELGIDLTQVDQAYIRVNTAAVQALWARTLKDGLKLSQRIWNITNKNKEVIENIIADAIVRGQDAFQTARELRGYLNGDGTISRALVRRAKEAEKRYYVPKDVRFEALRLARSETTFAFAEGTYLGGRVNPGYLGIRWVLSTGHPMPDMCDDFAQGTDGKGFWPKGDEPPVPHPQCLCIQVPQYEDPLEFAERARAWYKDPAADPELENWYKNFYLRGAA